MSDRHAETSSIEGLVAGFIRSWTPDADQAATATTQVTGYLFPKPTPSLVAAA